MKRLSADEYVTGILKGDRFVLSRAITLVESNRKSDAQLAQEVFAGLTTNEQCLRIGITGSPGVGKSSFIEQFGLYLIQQGLKVAVLAIDPSSQKTGGSILGDKTRMQELARNPQAYIRPSAAGKTLGGVARKTREAMLLCESAGFDVVLVETVGVGQSEIAVKQLTDFFLLLMLAGAGDELQGIKKGIMEMTDAIAITKADGNNLKNAQRARGEYTAALHLFPPSPSGWYPKVLTCSSLKAEGLAEIWETMQAYFQQMQQNGWLTQNRASQRLHWLHQSLQEQWMEKFYGNPAVQHEIPSIEEQVESGRLSPHLAAKKLLDSWR